MKTLLLVLTIISMSCLSAQDTSPFVNLRHSSRDAEGNLHLRFNAAPEMTFTGYQLSYRLTGEWQTAELNQLSLDEYEALIPYSFGQTLKYRMRAEMDDMGTQAAYMHPTFLDADSFPPALSDLAQVGTDTTGDSIMIYNTALDLTDSYIASSDTKLYRAIGNVSGAFPTLVSLTNYNLYLATITNPTAVSDSVAFAMVYTFNIIGVISPGLYKIGVDANMQPTFTRLGNIQSQVVGGKLYMSCNWSDLASDPQFGQMPVDYETLMITDMSMRISMDPTTFEPTFNIGDMGTAGFIEFTDLRYQVNQNTPPSLSLESFDPATGSYHFSYYDSDGDFPLDTNMLGNGGGYSQIQPYYVDSFGTARFSGVADNQELWTIRSSDNAIDYVALPLWVSNQDELAPPSHSISCRMPNPVSTAQSSIELHLSGLDKSPLTIKLFNLRGQMIAKVAELYPNSEQADFTWNSQAQLTGQPSGIYFMQLSQAGRTLNHRFCITK